MATEQKVQLNYLMITPRKVRLIANTLKGMTAQEAEAQLMLRPQRAADALLKLLRSAVANAKNNQGIPAEKLKIGRLWVDPAPVIKRSLPRSQGRATPLLHRMSHVTLILVEAATAKASRFVVVAPEKKKPATDAKKPKKVTTTSEEKKDIEHTKPELKNEKSKTSDAVTKQPKGSFKRFFNRKSV